MRDPYGYRLTGCEDGYEVFVSDGIVDTVFVAYEEPSHASWLANILNDAYHRGVKVAAEDAAAALARVEKFNDETLSIARHLTKALQGVLDV